MGIQISLAPEVLFHIGSFGVTNAFFWSVFLSLTLITITLVLKRVMKQTPGRFQGFVEVMIDGAFTFVEGVIGSKEKAKKIFPLVFTMFIFILFANLAVFIPGQSALTLKTEDGFVPLFRAVMSDYSIVIIMTSITIILTQIIAIAVNGPLGYIGKFICVAGFRDFFLKIIRDKKLDLGMLAQAFLDFVLGLMDIVGELSKIVSLSFRLFGNIFAGEVLTVVMLSLAPFFVPIPFQFLGLLTAVVQAFVFSVLTLIFVSMASTTEEAEA